MSRLRDFGTSTENRAFLRTESGHRIELLPNRVYVLGREDTCDLRVDDPGCSRQHAKISIAGNAMAIHVEDLRSKNGTYRNETRVKARVRLADGDRIRLGKTVYEIRMSRGGKDFELDTRTAISGK